MSTSLLYHAFGVKGYRHVRTEYRDGQVRFTVEPGSEDPLRCSHCGSQDVVRRGQRWRAYRGVSVGGRAVWIELPVQRVGCRRCRLVRQVKVAEHLRVSWGTVKDIHKRHLRRRRAGRRRRSQLWTRMGPPFRKPWSTARGADWPPAIRVAGRMRPARLSLPRARAISAER